MRKDTVPLAKMLQTSIAMASKRKSADVIFVAHEGMRNYLKAERPSVYDLYEAVWRAGYTVNGILPPSRSLNS